LRTSEEEPLTEESQDGYEDSSVQTEDDAEPQVPQFGGESTPDSKKQYRYVIPTYCTVNNKLWHCNIVSDEVPVERSSSRDGGIVQTEVVFLVDGTNSMGNEIRSIRRTCGSIAKSIQDAGTTVLIGLVAYGIAGKNFNWKKNMPKGVLKEYRKPGQLSGQEQYCTVRWPMMEPNHFSIVIRDEMKLGIAGRKGCYFAGNGTFEVLIDTLKAFSDFKEEISRFIIHISDEFDTTKKNIDLQLIVDTCVRNKITVHTWGRDVKGHTEISEKTGGKFWPINRDLSESEFDDILNSISSTIAEAISLRMPEVGEYLDTTGTSGPHCRQWGFAPTALPSSQNVSGRTRTNLLGENEGYMAIEDFDCMYCGEHQYFVCSCGAHSCRGEESETSSSKHSSEATCNQCGETVLIREESEVHSQASVVTSKKGK